MVYHVLILMSVILIMVAVIKYVSIKLDLTIVSVTVDILLMMTIMDAHVYQYYLINNNSSFIGNPNNCAANPNACEHICHTHNDSYYCTCYPGYRLASNGRTCDGE